MGHQKSRMHGSPRQDDRPPPKLSRHQNQILPVKLRPLPGLLQVKSQTIGEICNLTCHQYKIRTAEQLTQQERLHQLQCHPQLAV